MKFRVRKANLGAPYSHPSMSGFVKMSVDLCVFLISSSFGASGKLYFISLICLVLSNR